MIYIYIYAYTPSIRYCIILTCLQFMSLGLPLAQQGSVQQDAGNKSHSHTWKLTAWTTPRPQ